jgi:hypothetical protein
MKDRVLQNLLIWAIALPVLLLVDTAIFRYRALAVFTGWLITGPAAVAVAAIPGRRDKGNRPRSGPGGRVLSRWTSAGTGKRALPPPGAGDGDARPAPGTFSGP